MKRITQCVSKTAYKTKKEAKEAAVETAKKEAKEMATKYQMKEDEFLKAFGGLDMMKYDIKMRKAIEVLKGE